MAWIGLWDVSGSLFSPPGLDPRCPSGIAAQAASETLIPCGSLVLETRLTPGRRPQTLFRYETQGDWPVHLSLQSIPGGGLTLVVDQAGEISHAAINQAQSERIEILRITYSWDAPRKIGRLVMEHDESGHFTIVPVPAPRPMRLGDLRGLVRGGRKRFMSPDVVYLAVSTRIEPAGPMPSLGATTPIATPQGYRPVATLRRGDTVLTDTGATVPVLQVLSRTVPARGTFAPIQLRKPYFGLKQDLIVSPGQRLVISGSVVDYMFGTEAVLVNAAHLAGSAKATAIEADALITYHHVLLPRHETLLAAGSAIESLYIGRLRRKKTLIGATMLAAFDRTRLPEHHAPAFPILRRFDALVLAEQRSA